jgi:hypothetical protein
MRLEDMDPETRATALVGEFLREFAIAEEQVTTALSLLIDITDAQRELLLDGMPVGNKFRALKEVALDLPVEFDRQEIRDCAIILLKANSEVRVHVAHKRFGAGPKDLTVIKPGWKYEVETAWTTDEFTKRIHAIVGTRRPLLQLNNALGSRVTDRLFAQFAAKLNRHLAASKTVPPFTDD